MEPKLHWTAHANIWISAFFAWTQLHEEEKWETERPTTQVSQRAHNNAARTPKQTSTTAPLSVVSTPKGITNLAELNLGACEDVTHEDTHNSGPCSISITDLVRFGLLHSPSRILRTITLWKNEVNPHKRRLKRHLTQRIWTMYTEQGTQSTVAIWPA